MPSLFRRANGVYYLSYEVDGKRRWKSTGVRHKRQAVKAMFNFKEPAAQPTQRISLSEFVDEFLSSATANYSAGTIGIYKQALTKFLSLIGDQSLSTITSKHVDLYKTERLKTLSPTSLNIDLRTLRAAFYTAVRWKLIVESPFKQIPLMRIPERQPIYFSKEEFLKFIAAISEKWFKDLVIMAVSTGLRRGELLNLQWKNVDFQRKLIHIQSDANFHTKQGKKRIVPLSDDALRILWARFDKMKSDFVFAQNGFKILESNATHKFKAYIKKAGLGQELHFHSLRHTFASWLVQDGVSLYEVQKLLGHSNISITEVYSHLQPETLHSTVNRIAAPLN